MDEDADILRTVVARPSAWILCEAISLALLEIEINDPEPKGLSLNPPIHKILLH